MSEQFEHVRGLRRKGFDRGDLEECERGLVPFVNIFYVMFYLASVVLPI